MMVEPGFVYLVGAGPGDPKLLTLRAIELLRSAQVVAYDELVSQEILSLISPQTELLAVGRRYGHGMTRYRLHPMVLERARAGSSVVRLKSGDPLIFGRGSEEADELAEEGIPFEIVPGVSAAIGAAAYAGIPLTDRRCASRVTMATGHSPQADRDKSRETVVLYMASHRLKENLAQLIEQGHSPSTPAAYIVEATTPRQTVISGTIADLGDRVEPGRWPDPALVIVGAVVSLRDRIRWVEKLPIRGRRVLVARARPGLSRIAARLRTLGAHVLETPNISVGKLDDHSPLDRALAQIERFDAVVFACSAGVDAVVRRLRAIRPGLWPEIGVPLIAFGRGAAAAVETNGASPAVRRDGVCREALSESAAFVSGRRLLLITSTRGRSGLRRELEQLGATVQAEPAYTYSYPRVSLPEELPELIILPSSSATRLLLDDERGERLTSIPMIAMGPATEEAARAFGAKTVVRCTTDNFESVIEETIRLLRTFGLAAHSTANIGSGNLLCQR